MKLCCPQLETTFTIKPQILNRIVVENPVSYEALVLGFYGQIYEKQENLSCFLDDAAYAIAKHFELILSPMDIAYDKKEIQKKLYQDLADELEMQDVFEKIAGAYGELLQLVEEGIVYSAYPVELSAEFALSELFKQLGVQLKQPEGRFIEKLIDYGTTMKQLMDKQVFVLVNCAAYLTGEDYAYLEQWLQYEEVYVILLESFQHSLPFPVNEVIIDTDLCEIH